MSEIKFLEDRWEAIIAFGFTAENVQRVAQGIALKMKEQNLTSVVVSYDTRFGGKMFSKLISRVLAAHGNTIYISPYYATYGMLKKGMISVDADLGIYISAGSKPHFFNGIRIATNTHIFLNDLTQKIPDEVTITALTYKAYQEAGLINSINLEKIYVDAIQERFDFVKIRETNTLVVFDLMYGAAQRIITMLFPEFHKIRSEENSSFKDTIPHPVPENLSLLMQMTSSIPTVSCGFGFNSSADIFAAFDENGVFKEMVQSESGDGIWAAMEILSILVETGRPLSVL